MLRSADSLIRFPPGASSPDTLPARAPWMALVVVCFGQFMVILDATVVNVALPSIRTDLDLSTEQLQ